MGHLVLLGDSTLDNAAYVGGGPAVIDQARRAVPPGWRASLLAVDGARIAGIHRQLERLPADATHLAVSVGGNDLLAEAAILARPAGSVGGAIVALAEVRDRFEAEFAAMLRACAGTGLPTLVCSVYEPRFPDPAQRLAAAAALGLFADAVLRSARVASMPVLDLRAVCDSDADFANPIEPSSAGGQKIALAIAGAIATIEATGGRTVLFS